MSVKTEQVENQAEIVVVDDVSELTVVSEPANVEEDKLAALKAKMLEKQGKEQVMPPRIVEEKKRSLDFGVVGSGQGGSRLAECWFNLGYKSVILNTCHQDMTYIKIPESHKIFLDYGLGGASKDQQMGHDAAQAHKQLIASKIVDILGDCQIFVFCTSLGGGSGSGSIDTVIDIMTAIGKPIIVLAVLPMTNEDAQTKDNALKSLAKLANEVKNGRIQNLLVADNAKIETIYKDVGAMDFYRVSNDAVIRPLDIFNTYSSMPSNVKSLDPQEMVKTLIDGGGLSLYGEMTVPNYEEDTALAEAVIQNLTSGLLAEGFDLKQAKYVSVMFLANKNVWSKVPSSSINYAMAMVQDHAGTPLGVFKGIYESDSPDNVVKVYSMFTGLALPQSRVDELKKEVSLQQDAIKQKNEQRNINLNVDLGGSKAVSDVEKVKEQIKAKSSMLGKFTKSIVDKRK